MKIDSFGWTPPAHPHMQWGPPDVDGQITALDIAAGPSLSAGRRADVICRTYNITIHRFC